MMNTTESTEVREVTVRELVAAFDGKYVNVSPGSLWNCHRNSQRNH